MEKIRNYISSKKIHYNSLFFKLASAFIFGIVFLAICLFYVNFTISEKVFVDIFAESQSKIFTQIENEIYKFYLDLTEISSEIAKNKAVISYLTYDETESSNEMQTIFSMQNQISELKIDNYDNLTMLVVGNNDKSYMYGKTEIISESLEDIRNSSYTNKAKVHQGELIYEYVSKGFTKSTEDVPVVVCCRSIENPQNGQIIGYIYLIVREEEFQKFYSGFISGSSDIVILNQYNQVISSNNTNSFLMQEEEQTLLNEIVKDFNENKQSRQMHNIQGENITYMLRTFNNTNFTIIGTINPRVAFYQKYNISLNILITILVSIIVIIILFLSLQLQTQSLYKLINAMKHQKHGQINEYLDLQGTEEIRELSKAYNEMMISLNLYLKKVVETEQEKREAELRSLQAQINPHYIYNTLTSIKWLIMQKESDKAIYAMDAFIILLRNTIGNADEFVTVRQEIENSKYYILINQTRYGKRIQVEFYIPETCMEYKLPKMILQPFIENAFFHAFPNAISGIIYVFVRVSGEDLIIEITDDGVGMSQDSMSKNQDKKEHFSGIGINNVDERLKMMYGEKYGVVISSEKDQGTTITLVIKIKS